MRCMLMYHGYLISISSEDGGWLESLYLYDLELTKFACNDRWVGNKSTVIPNPASST